MTLESEVPLPPILCRIPEAAAALGRCERFIYEAIATGQLEAVKSGKRTLVVYDSIKRYADHLRATSPAKIKPIEKRRRVA
jgi:excisionase family DNA binding protein